MGKKFHKGYTLLEILIVVALLGIVLAIAIAAFSRYLQEYRLTSVTRRVAAAISLTRLKALSTNMDYTFTLEANVNPNVYQITGTTDINGNGVAEPWEDAFGTNAIQTDTIYDTAQSLENPVVNHVGISGTGLPNSANVSLAMDTGTTLTIVFNGRGVVKSMTDGSVAKQYILLQHQGLTHAIYVDDSGLVRFYKYQSPGWTEIN